MELKIKQEPIDTVVLNCFSCHKEEEMFLDDSRNVSPFLCDCCEANDMTRETMELKIKQEPIDTVVLNCFSCHKEEEMFLDDSRNVSPFLCDCCEANDMEYMKQEPIDTVVQNCFRYRKEESMYVDSKNNCESGEAKDKEYMKQEPLDIVVLDCFSYRTEESMDVHPVFGESKDQEQDCDFQSGWTYSNSTTSYMQYGNQEMIFVYESQSYYHNVRS